MTHLTLHQGGVDQDTRRLPAVTAVLEQFSGAVPEDAILQQNYPNPFNSSTSIPFALSEATDVNLGVYDLKGQRVSDTRGGMVAGRLVHAALGREGRFRTGAGLGDLHGSPAR